MRYTSRFGSFVVFAGLAIVAAGCSDARLAANNAASNSAPVQPASYQTGYGLTSEGPTTDLYHEFKHSLEPPERPQATAAVQQQAPAPVSGQQVAASGPAPAGAPQQAGTQQAAAQQPVAQQPAAPPREAPTATMYGMNSDGPNTDIYTALFGR